METFQGIQEFSQKHEELKGGLQIVLQCKWPFT